MTHPLVSAQEAAGVLRGRLGEPSVAVVLGSGWAAAAQRLGSVAAEMPLDDVPGAFRPVVEGHSGTARLVETDDRRVLLLGGRVHLYEGHDPHAVVHMVRAAVLAGCRTVILTNAAGSLDPTVGPGAPVLIRDQLNLTGTTPMLGDEPPPGFPGRFCDVTELYSPRLRSAARVAAPTLAEGVYAGMLGGAYETPAEIAMLATMGATLVGMSTVLEAIAARHLGAEVAGVSLVTNLAAGMAGALSHQEVLDVAASSTDRIVAVIGSLLEAAS